MKNIVRILAVAGLVVAVAAVSPSAQAGCPTPKLFSSFDNVTGDTSYLVFDSTASNASVVGRFWQDGLFATQNNGTYADELWLFPGATPGQFYINGDLGDPGVVGCPALFLITLVENNDGTFVLLRIDEQLADAFAFNYERIGGSGGELFTAEPYPRPQVTSSSRSGTDIILQVSLSSAAAGAYGPGAAAEISGYQILSASGVADPGRNRASYTVRNTLAGPGSVSVTVDCSNTAVDQFLVGGLTFDGGTVSSTFVSEATTVECDPNIADPTFKLIDKKPVGRPTPRR